MRSAIRKLGNSSGIIIPKTFLEALDITTGDAIELRAEDGRLIIDPVRSSHPREGWAKAASLLNEGSTEETDWARGASSVDMDWTW